MLQQFIQRGTNETERRLQHPDNLQAQAALQKASVSLSVSDSEQYVNRYYIPLILT